MANVMVSRFLPKQRPSWSGFMHLMHRDQNHPGKSNILFLSMIDLNASDMSCIYSTLNYLLKFARYNNFHPIVTFDQPLFWKASIILQESQIGSDLRDIVLMLGPFHTFMNLLDAIGSLMSGLGLEDILKQIFAEDASVHLRGHLIVDTCLKSENKIDESKFEEISNVFDISNPSLLNEIILKEIISHSFFSEMLHKLQDIKEKLAKSSKTCKLWVEYQIMVYLARKLIEADRSGSWKIPISHSRMYTNFCSRTVVPAKYDNIRISIKDVFEMFSNGYHVIRRSDKLWGDLGADLAIGQTLMRTLNTAGWLTRGGGQRGRWTLALPIVTEYSQSMEEVTEIVYSTSEQHAETSGTRITLDH